MELLLYSPVATSKICCCPGLQYSPGRTAYHCEGQVWILACTETVGCCYFLFFFYPMDRYFMSFSWEDFTGKIKNLRPPVFWPLPCRQLSLRTRTPQIQMSSKRWRCLLSIITESTFDLLICGEDLLQYLWRQIHILGVSWSPHGLDLIPTGGSLLHIFPLSITAVSRQSAAVTITNKTTKKKT